MTLQLGPHRFFLKGSSTLKAGWTEFYAPYAAEDSQELPSLQPGERVPVQTIAAAERFVEPPPRYNSNSLLREMEDAHIGTKATRSEIIDTLYKRGYIRKVRIEAMPIAVEVTRVLAKYCPVILDPKFTARLEELISDIQQGTRSRESTLLEALDHFRSVMLDLATFDDEIGSQLSRTMSAQQLANKTFTSPCPLCGSALKIIRSKRSKKRFIGCTGREEKGCSFSLPLLQLGTATILSRRCKVCGFQLVLVKSRSRRTVVSCPRCYANKKLAIRVEKVALVPDLTV